MTDELERQVHAILQDVLDVDAEALHPAAKLMTELGASSVDIVELVASLENALGIEVGDADFERLTTVDAVMRYVRTKRG